MLPFSHFCGLLSTPIILDAPLSFAPCATYWTRKLWFRKDYRLKTFICGEDYEDLESTKII